MFDTILHKYLRIPYRLNVYVDNKSKNPQATVVLLHGIGNSGASWDQVVAKLPKEIRVISIDLLGFGKSPSPRWMKYNTNIQAKAVIATLFRLNINQQLIIVGHSMGGLVAVEIAKRYPLFVKSLILCSTPFYNDSQKKTLLPNPNKVLRDVYRLMQKHPEKFIGALPIAARFNIVGKAFNVTNDNVDIYMAALESSVINQTAFIDVMRLKKPIQLLHGVFDPVVIKDNLDTIVKSNTRASLSLVVAGHELMGAYVTAVVKAIKKSAENKVVQ